MARKINWCTFDLFFIEFCRINNHISMRKFTLNLNMKVMNLLFAFILLSFGSFAQLSGIKTVGVEYADIASFVTDINTVGVLPGGGGVTLLVPAGHIETAPFLGINLTATGTITDPIAIQKSGAGANPIINAYTGGTGTPGTAVTDGIFSLNGSDYVTIDGIDLTDGNTTNPSTMEYGYGLFKASATDGCQFNTIKNCTVTLSINNNATGTTPNIDGSRGISLSNAIRITSTTTVTVTSAAGSNSNNKIQSNTILNTNYGISAIGFAASSPFTLADTGNEIGGTSAILGNIISNFGGAASASNPSAGIRTLAQYNFVISFNVLQNNNGTGSNHVSTLRGLLIGNATSAAGNINNNTLTINTGATTSLTEGINTSAGSTAASNTININNNNIAFGSTTLTTGSINGIINSGSANTVNIIGNSLTSSSATPISGTGTFIMIEAGSPTNANINSNSITGFARSGTSGPFRAIRITSPTTTIIDSNTIENIAYTLPTSTGTIDGVYSLSSAINVTITNNTIRNLATPLTGTITGIREFGVSGTKTISNNNVYDFATTFGGAGGATFYGIYCSTGDIVISSNRVSGLINTGGTAGVINGIFISGGTSSLVSRNKVYDLSSTSTGASLSGILFSGNTSNVAFNNLISGLSLPSVSATNPLNGFSVTGGTATSLYNNSVYLNTTSTGTNFGSSAVSTSTGVNVTLSNNIFINESTAAGTGLTVAFRRSSTTLTSFNTASNKNLMYAGVPSATNVIFYDGTASQQTLGNYQTFVAPRENLTISGEAFTYATPGSFFISLTGSSVDFLKPVTGIATLVESGASAITTPINLSTDYAAVTRATFAGYTGTGTAPDRGAFEFEGTTPAPIILLNSMTPNQTAHCVNVARDISVDVTTTSGTISTVVLNYTINGVGQTPISMTGAGSTYTATIPVVSPANANVTWNIVATSSTAISTTYVGASYSDEPLTGLTASASANPSVVCAGEATTLTALLTGPTTQTIGSAITTSTAAAINPFYGGYGGVKTQYIIRASELIAAGFSAGNINSVGINITSPGSTLTDLAINGQMTALTTLTTDIIDVTNNLYSNPAFVPTAGINTFNFSTPIAWNGTSNIILSFCWSNNNTLNTASTITYSVTGFGSSNARYVDSRTSAEVCGYFGSTTPTGWFGAATTSTSRPNFTFNGIASTPITTISWKDGSMTQVGTTNPLNITPLATTLYTADITAQGCVFSPSPTVLVTVNPLPASVTASNSVQCGAQVPTASVSSNTGATTPTFNWYTLSTGGVIAQSSTSTTFTSVIPTDTVFYVSEVDGSTGCESPRTAISITVTAADNIMASSSIAAICIGDNFTLTASNTNPVPVQSYSYSWLSSTGSGVETSQAGTSIIVTPTTSGVFVYNLTGVDGGCSNTNTVSVTVNALPVIDSPMASPSTVCSGDVIFLTADTYGVSPTAIVPIGAGALTTTSSTLFESPFYYNWGGIKDQFIVRASELTAAGIIAGNINSLGLDIVNAGANFDGFTIHIAHTANTVATTALVPTASLTQVYSNPSLVLTPNSLNTFNFSTPFNWDGVSNIIIQTSWSNNNGGVIANSAYVKNDNTSFVSMAYYRVDNATPATVLAANTGNGTYSRRPKFTFSATAVSNVQNSMTWNWMPGTGLNTADTSVVIVNNSGAPMTQAFTVTLTNPTTGCVSNATTAAVTINTEELAPVAMNSVQCGTGIPTASVVGSGNASNTFQWYLIPTGGTPLAGETGSTLSSYSINTTTTFYVGESNGLCLSDLTPVTVTVTTPPAIAATGTAVICLNDTGMLNVTSTNDPNYTYTWSNGLGTGASVNASPMATTTYTVTATDMSGGTNNGCITSTQFTVVVNPLPLTSPISSSTTEICIGDEIIALNSSFAGGSFTIGTGTVAPTTTSWPNPLSAWYGGAKHQMVYTAAELTAQGLTGGSTISKVGFNLAAAAGGACVDFTIRMKQTASTTLAGFETGTTTVYGPLTFTPSAIGQVDFTLTTPFVWDGTSNIIVETVHNAGNTGNGLGTTAVATTMATNMTYRRASDNVVGGVPAFDALTTSFSQGATTSRTNVIFTTLDVFPIWSPMAELFMDATATTAYTGGAIDTVYANLSATNTIYATYVSNLGCMDSTSQLITINQLPLVDAGAIQTICTGDMVTLTGSGATTYVWDNSVVNGTAFSPTTTATYTVEGTDANGCINTDMVNVVVNALPTATVTNNGDATITAGSASTYQWLDCGSNMIIPGATSQTLTVTANGLYSVIVTNANGCTDTSACLFIGNVDIKEVNSQVISVYPNPTHDNVIVEFNMNNAQIEVIDALGAILEVKNIQSGDIVSLSSYNRGVYFIKVVSESGTSLHRIVKN